MNKKFHLTDGRCVRFINGLIGEELINRVGVVTACTGDDEYTVTVGDRVYPGCIHGQHIVVALDDRPAREILKQTAEKFEGFRKCTLEIDSRDFAHLLAHISAANHQLCELARDIRRLDFDQDEPFLTTGVGASLLATVRILEAVVNNHPEAPSSCQTDGRYSRPVPIAEVDEYLAAGWEYTDSAPADGQVIMKCPAAWVRTRRRLGHCDI